MSEKRKIQRFNLDEGRIWEAIEGLSPFKTTYTLEEVCEKLNELAEENDNCKNDYRELFSNYVALEEKNEQLEKGKMEALSLLGGEIDKNEQLQQENNFLKQIREAFQIDVKNSRQKRWLE